MTLMVGASFVKELFAPYVAETIGVLKEIQDSIVETDPLKVYLLNAWQRIATTLESDFAPYLQEILQGILSAISAVTIISAEPEFDSLADLASLMSEDIKKVPIKTVYLEDKDLPFHALITIIDVLKGLYAPYAEQTTLILLPLINYTPDEHVRAAAANLCESLIGSVKALNTIEADQKIINMARLFLGVLWKAIAVEVNTDTILTQLRAIKFIIEAPRHKFMSFEEVIESGERLIKMLEISLERWAINKDSIFYSDSSEDELIKENIKEDKNSLHLHIFEALRSLFKTHREFSLEIVNFLYSHKLCKFLAPGSSDEDHKIAISIICDALEFVGEDLSCDKWNFSAEVLVRFTDDLNMEVRQAALYGIGILAMCSNATAFAQWAEQILTALDKSINAPAWAWEKKIMANEYAIAALGKIIKHQSGNVNLASIVPVWINLLPLKHDKEEAKRMHDLLADITIENMSLAIGKTGACLKSFGDILETKLITNETACKIKQIFQIVQSAGIHTFPQIWASLNGYQRLKLTKLVA